MVARREVKEDDGVPSRPKQMVVKVGSGSSGDTFELKGVEWADVKAGSLDAAVPASVQSMLPSLQLKRPHFHCKGCSARKNERRFFLSFHPIIPFCCTLSVPESADRYTMAS